VIFNCVAKHFLYLLTLYSDTNNINNTQLLDIFNMLTTLVARLEYTFTYGTRPFVMLLETIHMQTGLASEHTHMCIYPLAI